MAIKTELARRNTAVATASLLQAPVQDLMRTEVPLGACIWSFDPTDPANEDRVFLSENPGTRDWTQHLTEPFELESWTAKKIELSDDKTGDTSLAIRVVLFDPSGETLAFVSSGVCASLDLIRTLRGDGPYTPPIRVIVVPVSTRRGFITKKLQPVAQTGAAKIAKNK